MLSSDQQVENLLKSALLRAAQGQKIVSMAIGQKDKNYIDYRCKAYKKQMGLDILVFFPKEKAEVWLVPKSMEGEIYGKPSGGTVEKGNLKLV